MSAQFVAGMAICMDFARKICYFEAAPQERLTPGKGLEASRATTFLSKSSAHRGLGESVSRLIDVSAHLLAAIAIFYRFCKENG